MRGTNAANSDPTILISVNSSVGHSRIEILEQRTRPRFIMTRTRLAFAWAVCLAASAHAFQGSYFPRTIRFLPDPGAYAASKDVHALKMQLAPRPKAGWTQNSDNGSRSPASADPMTLGLRRFNLDPPAPNSADLTGQSRIFLDSGQVEDYAQLLPLGTIWGVTTNPTILCRAGVPCTIAAIKELAAAAFSFGASEFMAQTWGGPDVGALIERGLQIASIDPRVVVKVPVTAAGLEAATLLQAQGVRICLTAVYSSHQVVSSVAVGAEYAAPYLGRMNDSGKDGLAEVACMQSIVDNMKSQTRVLVASVRSANEVADLAGDSSARCREQTRSLETLGLNSEALTAKPFARTRVHDIHAVCGRAARNDL